MKKNHSILLLMPLLITFCQSHIEEKSSSVKGLAIQECSNGSRSYTFSWEFDNKNPIKSPNDLSIIDNSTGQRPPGTNQNCRLSILNNTFFGVSCPEKGLYPDFAMLPKSLGMGRLEAKNMVLFGRSLGISSLQGIEGFSCAYPGSTTPTNPGTDPGTDPGNNPPPPTGGDTGICDPAAPDCGTPPSGGDSGIIVVE